MLTPELLKQYTPLHNLTDANLARLAGRLQVEEIPKGGVLCREGDTDNDALFLLEGGVELRSHSSSMTRVLMAGAPEAYFPLAPDRPRRYTAIATSPVRLFRVDNASLDRAVLLDEVSTTITRLRGQGSEQFAGDSAWIEEMMQNPAFQALPKERLALLLLKFEPCPVKAGDAVVRQGDPGDYYYVVKDGRFGVARKDEQGRIQVLNELKRGAVFGEEALLLDAPRNASIVALGDGLVMRLPRSEFEQLLKKPMLQYVSAAEARAMLKAGAGLLDVRTPEEYRHGSLKGSQNLPIEELRARLRELDPQRSYVLICRNGNQSEAAAFLLTQRGYQVAVLRGGLNASASR
jgi:CRP-like cAMP-binding protein